jgi:hypothetical protein
VNVAVASLQLPGAAVRVLPTTPRPEIVGGEREASGGGAFPGDGAGVGCGDGAACAAGTVAAGTEDVETDTCA